MDRNEGTSRMHKDALTLRQRAMSSCVGAVVTSFSMTPFDVVKVRLQEQQHRPLSSAAPSRSYCSTSSTRRHRHRVTPFDVVKIRLQRQSRSLVTGQCFVYRNGLMDFACKCESMTTVPCPWYNRPGHFNGTIDAFVKIARNEGPRSLWSGLSPTLVMAVPATIFYFSLYDHLLLNVRSRVTDGQLLAPMLAGSSARAASVTLISPLEMIRTKLQSEKLSYKDIWKALLVSRQSDGWVSLWRGWSPSMLRDVPFSALYWLSYEWLKKSFITQLGLHQTTFFISFCSGAMAGSFAALVTLPFDVIKTHRQVAMGQLEAMKAKGGSTSTFSLMRNLAKERGVQALFAGVVPRLAKVAPACAIMIGSYEYGKLFFGHRNRLAREASREPFIDPLDSL